VIVREGERGGSGGCVIVMPVLRSVVLAGGGTAGHVEPALAVADALRASFPKARLTMLGTRSGLEARLVPARGYELALVPRVPLPRRPSPSLLTVPGRLAAAVLKAGETLDETRADVVIGFGGYVAVPAYLAARRRGIPIVVHEANPLPGVANRLGARLTSYVAVSHQDTPLRGARFTGVPLRAAVLRLDRSPAAARVAQESYGLAPGRPTLLVTGGSQGARRINDAMVAAAGAVTRGGVQVLHAAGEKNIEAVLAALPSGLPAPYVVRAYLDDMPSAYAAADLALCRSGAMTCAELAAVGLPAAFVPLPYGNGEQRRNARPTVDAGGGLLVEDADLTPDWIVSEMLPVLTDPARLATMEAGARRAGRPDAAERIVELVVEAAGDRRRSSARHAAR
jgi:UDP-N-acetylglucosamine--N-acetylmuramyl-(pentapeptide) pyrophosphoryl-undecaprenol N-acetylglucosamine transferase